MSREELNELLVNLTDEQATELEEAVAKKSVDLLFKRLKKKSMVQK